VEWTVNEPKSGDMIRTKVSFYHHYGIFVNDTCVIQFGLPNDVSKPAETVKVIESDVYTFLGGGELEVAKLSKAEKSKRRSPEETVRIAKSRLGEGGYDILHNNCEHFANFCLFGERKSDFLQDVRDKLRKKLGR